MKATWKGTVVAESDKTIVIEGNHYFPPDSVKWDYFEKTDHTSVCPWKGNAIYYTITVNGEKNDNAAWSYPEPKKAAKEITGYVAFWKGVEIT